MTNSLNASLLQEVRIHPGTLKGYAIVAGLAVAVFSMTFPVLAQPVGGNPEQHGGHAAFHARMEGKIDKMYTEIGVPPEKAQQLKSIRKASKEQSYALREQVKEKRHAMMDYLASPDATQAGAQAQLDELTQLQRQMGEVRIQTWFQMREHLTPEQLSQVKDKMKEFKDHHGPHGKRGHWGQKGHKGHGPDPRGAYGGIRGDQSPRDRFPNRR